MNNITGVEDVPGVRYEPESDDLEGYLSEQLISLKQRRSGLMGAVTKLQKKLNALIANPAATHPMVAEVKDKLDERLATCLRTCQEYLQKIPQDDKHEQQRTEAIEKLHQMKERQREADEEYTAYTRQCNQDASTRRSSVSARSSRSSACSSARRKRLLQAQIEAEEARLEAQLVFEQDMVEAKAEEERLEAEAKAEAKRLEAEAKAEAKRLEAKQRIQKNQISLKIAMSRAEASVKRAALEAEYDDDLLDASSVGSSKSNTGAEKIAPPASLAKPSTSYGNPFQVTSNARTIHQVPHAQETPRADEAGRMSRLRPTANAFTPTGYNELDKGNTYDMHSWRKDIPVAPTKIAAGQNKLHAHSRPLDVFQEGPISQSAPSDHQRDMMMLVGMIEENRSMMRRSTLPRRELEKFEGNPLHYFVFMKGFKETIQSHIADPTQQLRYLIDMCIGEAHESIKGCIWVDPPEEGLRQAFTVLEDLFGRREDVVAAHLQSLFQGPQLKGDEKDLRKLYNDMSNCRRVLEAWDYAAELDSYSTLKQIFKRLPYRMQESITHETNRQIKMGKRPTFAHLLGFIEEKMHACNNIYGRTMARAKEEEKTNRVPKTRNLKTSRSYTSQAAVERSERKVDNLEISTRRSNKNCIVCQGEHPIWRCDQFQKKSIQDRRRLVRNSGLCFNCLGAGHRSTDCKMTKKCKTCNKSHHSLLHVYMQSTSEGEKPKEEKDSNDPVKPVESFGIDTNHHGANNVRLKVVPVRAWGHNMRKPVECYAFLDEGSDTSFCSDRLSKQLGLQGPKVQLHISCINGEESQQSKMVSLSIQGLSETAVIDLEEVMTLSCLPKLKGSIPSNKDVTRYPFLEGLQFPAIPTGGVELLIGAGARKAHVIHAVREGGANQPTAVRTGLGWTLVGPEPATEDRALCQVNYARCDNHILHEQMQRMFDHDFVEDEDSEDLSYSVDDIRAMHKLKSSVQKKDGRYQLGLLWKTDNVTLPYNRFLAVKRLAYLKRKLEKDMSLFDQYKKKINELLQAGYAKPVPEGQSCHAKRTWYIPHHCCTGGKFRVVYDCAAKYKGTSLNENLLQGPDQTNSLVGVLLRFRQGKIAFTADIKGMFHQVLVDPEDRDALRFLWWPDDDMTKPPSDYQMLVHPFGATSSPCCASYALKKVADDNDTSASLETLSTVKQNFYVDDCLKSVNSVEEAIQLAREIGPLLASGGFHLTKYLSNCKELLSVVDRDDLMPSLVNMDLDKMPVERALGVYWNTATDVFEITVDVKPKPSTRRGILSMMSQVFDPMGYVQPFFLPIKRLMQRLCQMNMSWDDPVPEEMEQAWLKWLHSLPDLEAITIPRCFNGALQNPVVELHCFCDASEVGYGAVCYLRFVDGATYHCSFVIGKSRVAPLKSVTIPRLELSAAVVGAKLSRLVVKELQLKIKRAVYWTDSTSVLQYISNTSKRFQTFVANRLSLIHKLSTPSQWRHVDTKRNPADIASRGLMPNEISKATLWFHGPEFLWNAYDQWPSRPSSLPPLPDDDPELKTVKEVNSFTAIVGDNGLHKLLRRYSRFHKLVKAVVWLLRYKQYVMWKHLQRENIVEPPRSLISTMEMGDATNEIVRLVQMESFPAVIRTLEKRQEEDSTNQSRGAMGKCRKSVKLQLLGKLNPYLSRGVLRVGGRLQRSLVSHDKKHPMILPSRHEVTGLVVNHYHAMQGHCGTLHVLASIREKFWIVRGHSAVRYYLKRCLPCRVWKAKTGEQLMAPLPEARVTPGHRPFTNTGVDYMGPLMVKQGRSQVKRYGCIFTCLATRAIHIEIAFSLETSSFISAYRRFINRWGSSTKKMFSDNGSNFVGAERELHQGIQRWNKKQIHEFFCQKSIDWHFNPPLASHQGGVWERMIRTVRKILRSIAGERVFDEESLVTFMSEVESIINNRPLTPVSDDPDDLSALTPMSILAGSLEPSLPPDEFLKADGYRRSWRFAQLLADQFWQQWIKDYLPLLQQRQKWLQPIPNFKTGDLVLMVDETKKRGHWPKARVEETYPDKEGRVRRVQVKTADNRLMRDIRKLCLLEAT
ncbi:uncharacterized protein LOC143453439 [Clavelina lepadiformis]|uniref:uncharacterized protein LOC143453439 n=1 Tax=Clavelina lepadiformis TaxID=159417 RepID=UPI004042F2FC